MKSEIKNKNSNKEEDIFGPLNTEKIKIKLGEISSKLESNTDKSQLKTNKKIEEKQKIETNEIPKKNQINKKCISISCIKKSFIKHKIPFIITIISAIIIVIALIFILKYVLKKKETNKHQKEDINIIPNQDPESALDLADSPIKKEFNVITKIGDLKRISVVQKSKEETKINSEIITNEITRKTNYDIYFESEEDATEENKKYYSKMYKGFVSILSECTVVDDNDCEPQKLVDLTSEQKNLRLLNSENFKNVPLVLCIFNITDNNVITTMTCPESLPDNKRNEIILDLYFFRPPAAERADKEGDNITLTIKQENQITKIHETNGGFCNIYNNLRSICTTDMNTTLDKEGNLLNYNEQAITIINYDDKNSYYKDKRTNLIDISETIKKSDIENYKHSLNNL